MLKKYKKSLILSSVVTLLPTVFGLVFWNKLPDLMTTHWNVNGVADGYSSKAFAVFAVPLIVLALHWLCVLISSKDKGNENQNTKAMQMVLWICPFISCFVCSIMFAAAWDKKIDVSIFVVGFLGLLFVVIGNYMPKCKQNFTLGIRVKWTLTNEENWNATHRFAGKIWVVGGILMAVTGLLLPVNAVIWVLFVGALVLAFIPMIYSYTYYKKQLAAGLSDAKAKLPMSKGNKTTAIVGTVIAVVIAVFAVYSCFSGDVDVHYDETTFTVQASYYQDLTVDYATIESIEYREDFAKGMRIIGFGSPRLSMGLFENDEFGRYTLYAYTASESAVLLYSQDEVLVLNGEDAAATKAIYDTLLEKVS